MFRGRAGRRIGLYVWFRGGAGETLGTILRATGLPKQTVLSALRVLVEDGLLVKTERGDAFPRYAPRIDHPFAREIRGIAVAGLGAAEDQVQALVDDPGVAYAAIYGSWARGSARPTSDIDLLVAVTGADRSPRTLSALEQATLAGGNELNPVVVEARDLAAPSGFLAETLRGPLIILKGRKG